jgi:hypothetical protein
MTMEPSFPLTLHFSTLYLDKLKKIFLINEGMYLVQVLEISCILLKFYNYYKFLKYLLRKFISITKYNQNLQILHCMCKS